MTIAGGLLRGGDGVTISNIPAGLDVYAGYSYGSWLTYLPLVAEYPTSLHLAYTESSVEWGDCLDIEAGAANDLQAANWMGHVWTARNTPKPALYTSVSNMGPLITTVNEPRSSYLLLAAHYTNTPHICTSAQCWPSSPIPWVADGSQWSDNGGRWDSLLFNDDFFTATTPTPISEDDPMGFILAAENVPTIWIVQGCIIKLPDTPSVAAVEALGAPVHQVPPELITAALA